jgi:predicted NACHT family NTPase
LKGHQNLVTSLAFSPDGKVLASGSSDSTVRLWRPATGKELRRFEGHRGLVKSVAFSGDGQKLASAGVDTTVLVWDVSGLVPRTEPVAQLQPAELQALWEDLAGDDAARASRAIEKLAAAPTQATTLLKQQLRPAAAADPKLLAGLIADLGNDDFNTREKATKELEKLGEHAEPALRKALEEKPAPEARRRLEALAEKASALRRNPSPERVRTFRSLEVLERAGTAEARQVLEALAQGAPGARLTEEAKAAAERLAKRSAAKP